LKKVFEKLTSTTNDAWTAGGRWGAGQYLYLAAEMQRRTAARIQMRAGGAQFTRGPNNSCVNLNSGLDIQTNFRAPGATCGL
jgi:hypothetical protein